MITFKIVELNYFITTMIVLAVVSLLLNALTTGYWVITVTSTVILLNSAILFYFNYHCNEVNLTTIPFLSMYGPLFHTHIRFFSTKPINLKYLATHFTTVLCLFALYFFIVFFVSDTDLKISLFYLLYLLQGLSLLIYSVLIILMNHSQVNLKLRNIYVLNAFFLTMVSVSMIIGIERSMHQKPSHAMFNHQQIPFCILIGAFGWSYFFSCVYLMTRQNTILPEWLSDKCDDDDDQVSENREVMLVAETPGGYSKSRLSDEKLDEYLNDLNQVMMVEEIYTDPEITLEKLAKKLRIPPSHLTQLLNIKIGQNFYSYLNGLRAEHALSLLQQNKHKIYDVYIRSGFSNRVSFNRYFKKLTGNTPSEYIKSNDLLER